MSKFQINQNVNQAIEVMHHVGSWMETAGLNPSIWWQPTNMNREFLLQHTEPDEFFVLLVDNQPAASMVLQETERSSETRLWVIKT